MEINYQPANAEGMICKRKNVNTMLCFITGFGFLVTIIAYTPNFRSAFETKTKLVGVYDIQPLNETNSRRPGNYIRFLLSFMDKLWKNATTASLDEINSTAAKFSYKTLEGCNDGCGGILLKEYRDGKLYKKGGSFFRVTVEDSRRLYVGEVSDNEDGTYTITYSRYSECVNITIALIYYDFLAYFYPSFKPLDRIVVNKQICDVSCVKDGGNYTGWHRDNTSDAHLAWYFNRRGSIMNSTAMRKCMTETILSLTAVGDSHLKHMVYYMWLLLGDQSVPDFQQLNSNLKRFQYEYAFVGFTQDFLLALKAELYKASGKQYNSRDVILLDTVYWDVTFKGWQQCFLQTIPSLVQNLSTIRNTERWKNSTVIFTNMPAFPRNGPKEQERVGRNNIVISALNSLLFVELAKVDPNVIYFDLFAMTLPRSEDSTDGIHYIQSKSTHSIGDVGMAATKVLIQNICSLLHK